MKLERCSKFLYLVACLIMAIGIFWEAPCAQAVDLLVGSREPDQVLRYDGQTGSFIGAFVPAGSAGLSWPYGLVYGPDGNLYVSNRLTSQISRYHGQSGAFIDAFVPSGSGGLVDPTGLVFGPDGNLYVSGTSQIFAGPDQVLRYDGKTGAFIDVFVPAGSGGVVDPVGLAFGPDGNLYVSSFATHQVLRYKGQTGAFIDAFVPVGSGGLFRPTGLVFGPDGNLYVSGRDNNTVLRYNGKTGAFIDAFVPTGSGGLNGPHELAFGPDRNLYISSEFSKQILRYDGQTGAFIDAFVPAGSGGLNGNSGLAFTKACFPFTVPANGRLFLQPMGGEASADTEFGIVTSSGKRIPFFTGLPNNPNPNTSVSAGLVTTNDEVHFYELTTFFNSTQFAFSDGTDFPSLEAFSDRDNSLGMGGCIIEQTGPLTWLLHLDDAFSSDDDDNDVLIQIRLEPVVSVSIDIKPGSFPNSINPKSEGVIPVAILSTDTFDATTVDPSTVKFGPDEASVAHRGGHREDVNGDGKKDLVLHFPTQDTGIACGDTSASLNGKTFSGQAIAGSDSIRTVGCKPEHKLKHGDKHGHEHEHKR